VRDSGLVDRTHRIGRDMRVKTLLFSQSRYLVPLRVEAGGAFSFCHLNHLTIYVSFDTRFLVSQLPIVSPTTEYLTQRRCSVILLPSKLWSLDVAPLSPQRFESWVPPLLSCGVKRLGLVASSFLTTYRASYRNLLRLTGKLELCPVYYFVNPESQPQ
jgi:hypothetical protein